MTRVSTSVRSLLRAIYELPRNFFSAVHEVNLARSQGRALEQFNEPTAPHRPHSDKTGRSFLPR